MNYKILSKIISAGVLGTVQGLYVHADYVHNSQLGRNAFLLKEGLRWDKYMAHPHSLAFYVIVWPIALGIFLGVYELLALIIFKLLRIINKPTTPTQ